MMDGDGVCGINMAVSYPNLLLEPTPTTYWLILGCFAFAALVVVPCSCFGLNRVTKVEQHPGHDALKKTLIFEGISFSFCFVFYMLSVLSNLTNYQFKEMIVFAFYCALHITQLSLHNALSLRNAYQMKLHQHQGMSKCPQYTFAILFGVIVIIALAVTLLNAT